MLVLSRREGETVHIGDQVSVTVVRISGNKIRLGIETREELPILRGELRDPKPSMRIMEFELPSPLKNEERCAG